MASSVAISRKKTQKESSVCFKTLSKWNFRSILLEVISYFISQAGFHLKMSLEGILSSHFMLKKHKSCPLSVLKHVPNKISCQYWYLKKQGSNYFLKWAYGQLGIWKHNCQLNMLLFKHLEMLDFDIMTAKIDSSIDFLPKVPLQQYTQLQLFNRNFPYFSKFGTRDIFCIKIMCLQIFID